jgi:hypothetical protein
VNGWKKGAGGFFLFFEEFSRVLARVFRWERRLDALNGTGTGTGRLEL